MTRNTSENSDPILLDAKGLKCPMPVIKLQQQVRLSRPGDLITIACTDSSAEKDIASWTRVNKHQFIQVINTDYGCDITIQVKPK
ncbi:MAG TPA: sulfurtransferase TusA family protein [Thiomicrospira sp.]|nr:sulfurtransferase TusA family protein [Thiomicrospira sp.]